MKILNKCFLIVLLCLIPLNTVKSNNKTINQIHEILSLKEKKDLELLFRYFFSESFGYVLFGNKPIAISNYYIFNTFKDKKFKPLYEIAYSFYQANNPQNKAIKNGWKVWKKYSKYFLSSQYIFLEEPNPWNENTKFIICINKKLFIDTVNLYKKDFQKVLKKEVNPEDFLNRCLKGESLLTDILQQHDGLIGTLLGYGRDNSWNYYERKLLRKRSIKNSTQEEKLNKKLLLFAQEDCQKTWDSIKQYIEQSENDISDYSYISEYMSLPNFLADPNSEETKKLEYAYREVRKKILDKYKDQDFLIVTLKQLSLLD